MHRIVGTPCRSIADGLEVTPERLKYLIAAVRLLLVRLQRSFNRSWFEHAKELVFNCIVDTQPPERNAARLAIVEPAAPACIARNVMIAAGIVAGQLMAAAPAVTCP